MNKFLCVLILACCACSVNQFALNKKAEVNEVGIYLKMEPGVPQVVQDKLRQSVAAFVREQNASRSKIRATETNNPRTAALTIHVFETQLVTNGQQVAGALVSLAGLSLPFVMIGAGAEFAIFFYYFPRAVSFAELSLSKDIALNDYHVVPKKLTSPGFLKSETQQIEKHGDFFKKYLTTVFRAMEKSRQ